MAHAERNAIGIDKYNVIPCIRVPLRAFTLNSNAALPLNPTGTLPLNPIGTLPLNPTGVCL